MPGWVASAVRWLAKGLLIAALLPLLYWGFFVTLVFTNCERSLSGVVAAVIVATMLVGSVFMYLVGPFLLLSPVVVPLAALWRHPMRTLLLRPFNRATSTNYLSRLTRRVLAPLGHTYTLSDQGIHTSWYRRVPLLLGQLQLLSFRFGTLRHEHELTRLSEMISRTFFRNLNWFLSRNQIFPIRAKDELWVRAVETLVAASDLIIIDVTDRKPNVVHEIEICQELKKRQSVILIVEQEQFEETRRFMHDAFGAPEMPIVPYSGNSSSFDTFTTELAMLIGFAEPKQQQWKNGIIATGLAAAMAASSAAWWHVGGSAIATVAPEVVASHSPDFDSVLSVHREAVVGRNSKLTAIGRARLKKDFRAALLREVRTGLEVDEFERTNERVRAEWLAIIAEIGTDEDHQRLFALLRFCIAKTIMRLDGHVESAFPLDTHVAIVEAMIGLHADPWPHLGSQLLASSSLEWSNVLTLVRKFRYRGAVPNLVACLDDGFKRSDAVAALVELEGREGARREVVPKLLEKVEVRSFLSFGEPIRDALAPWVDESTIPFLIAALTSPREATRDYAISALERLRAHSALPALIRLIPTSFEARRAASSIVDFEDFDVVCQHVRVRDEEIQAWATEQLTRLTRENRGIRCR